ncbi:MAG: hypothetical protein K9I34_04010 [Bacteroidales bacterium]|nr:hypothetical protein [Bacteroidales bacterium]
MDKLKQVFGDGTVNLKILEEVIDINLQLEYFKLAGDIKSNPDKYPEFIFDENFQIDTLVDDPEKFRIYIIQLAQSANPKAFGCIEKIIEKQSGLLRGWAVLALQEARMVLEAALLEENHVFISTGLGGKSNKLRYFIVLIHKDEESFSDFQRKILNNEIQYKFNTQGPEIEKIEIIQGFVFLTALLPISCALGDFFRELISNCNEYGDFLDEKYIITNVKILTLDEVKDFIKNKEGR